ncbi:MAG TPA: Ig-like domain-containing protein [Tepidisphaeraceae bacterium]
MSASVADLPYRLIGPSAGLSAAANGAVITKASANVLGAQQANPTINVDLDTAIVFNVAPPVGGGGVDDATLTGGANGSVRLFDVTGGNAIVSTEKPLSSGGGDTVTLRPSLDLLPNRTYRVEINTGAAKAADVAGNVYDPFNYQFTTGTFVAAGDDNVFFDKSEQVVKGLNQNGSFSAITIGPDGKLYAATLQGFIYRYDINAATGALSNETTFDIIRDNNGGGRFITGLTFDPRSTAANPVLWVSHGQQRYGDNGPGTGIGNFADNYTGKISRLTKNLTEYQDVIVGIPRSVKDHLNNQIAFDAVAKNLYFVIPSNTAMGAPDTTWGMRPEDATTAALFRLQLRSKGTRVGIEEWLSSGKGPIDLTVNSNGSLRYNPFKGTNPLRFYATGIRNAYDMVFHSNGRLYLPTNGSAAGGNTPTGGGVTGVNNVQQDVEDYLLDVQEGGYYGQPNPQRNEFVLNGGNPTSGTDAFQVPSYAVGTLPSSNYRGAAYSYGLHISPNGVIEYKSNAFGGRLKGALITARYNAGSDLVVVKPNADGSFSGAASTTVGINGFKDLGSPLDLVENPLTGDIYVASLTTRTGGNGKITLLHPRSGTLTPQGGNATRPTFFGFYDAPGDTTAATRTITLQNTGNFKTVFDPSLVRFTGRDRKLGGFEVTNLRQLIEAGPVTLDPPSGNTPGDSVTLQVKYIRTAGSGDRAVNLVYPTGKAAVGEQFSSLQLRGFAPAAANTASAFSKAPIKAAPLAAQAAPKISVTQKAMYFNAVKGTGNTQILRVTNTGDRNLTLRPGAVTLLGGDRRNFSVEFPADGISIRPGRRFDLKITFNSPVAFDGRVRVARVRILSTDPVTPAVVVSLNALPTNGIGNNNEPSLQKVFDVYGFTKMNTGDTTPDEYQLGTPSSASTETTVQALQRVDPKLPVVIRPLAVFGTDNGPTVRVGTYTPGRAESGELLWYVPRESAQSVQPIVYGQTQIDPGSAPFGLIAQFPGFNNNDASDRLVYSEDSLNSNFEPSAAGRRKMRFYPYIDQNGTAVPNAYIVAVEEFTSAYDQQDVVFVVTNVQPAAAKPTLGVTGQFYSAENNRLVFNKVENSDPNFANVTRTEESVFIRNTGSGNLAVNLSTSGSFAVVSGGTSFTLGAGEQRTVTVRFTASSGATNSGSLYTGNLTINSNDPTNPQKIYKLAGWWQEFSEFRPENNGISLEPSSRAIVQDLFGYTTVLANDGQSLSTNGVVRATGEEVLSPYWEAADDNGQVRVTQLASYHNQTFTDPNTGNPLPTRTFLSWFKKGSATVSGIGGLTHISGAGQSVLPRRQNGSPSTITAGAFQAGNSQFGFLVEGAGSSDPAKNRDADDAANFGHFVRFWPAKDSEGKVIPNSYLMLHDYNREFTNYDFNDNIYLVENIVPADAVKSPLTVFTEDTSKGARIAFTSPATGSRITGFNVFRSSTVDGAYSLLNDAPLARRPVTVFVDTSVTANQTFFYKIVSVGTNGKVSQPVTVRV